MKWYTYIICFVFICLGVFCGIELYRDVKAESYINGSIDISNRFSKESFNYSSTSVVFYHDIYDDTNTYYFEIDLVKIEDFNGKTKEYKVVLNDYILIDTDIKAGSVFAVINMDFYDTTGQVVCSSPMNIAIQFLSSKTTLVLSTTGQTNARFFEQYFSDNGIRLVVDEII